MYAVTNPTTGVVLEKFADATDDEVRDAISSAYAAYLNWRQRSVPNRAAIVRRAGELFEERAGDLAAIITTEMGKRTAEGLGELQTVVDIFKYYADNAEKLLKDEPLDIAGGRAVVQKRPIGVLIGIMPWNYPYYQVARFAAPNLVLGNAILLKHAPSCPKSSAAIAELLHDAGVPKGVYTNLYATNEQVQWMLSDDRIQGVSLTGSERAGTAVAEAAGRNLKKVVLELGGSDPMVILDSDDVGRTAAEAVESRLGNSGQACNAPKRMIVMNDIYDEFVADVCAKAGGYLAGDPSDPATTLAPLSSARAADHLVDQIRSAVSDGARLLIGGERLPGEGAFVTPAVLTDVKPGTRAYREELFGPVIVVYRANSETEAVALANDTAYGLGASVFSNDPERARRVAEQIDSGMVYINAAGGSQADLPFGGVKRSGVGRELGPLGIEEFMNKKVIRL